MELINIEKKVLLKNIKGKGIDQSLRVLSVFSI